MTRTARPGGRSETLILIGHAQRPAPHLLHGRQHAEARSGRRMRWALTSHAFARPRSASATRRSYLPIGRRGSPGRVGSSWTRCAVHVLPCPVGSPMRFKVAAMFPLGPGGRSHAPDHGQSIVGGGDALVLTRSRLAQSQLGVATALPVDCQNDLTACRIDVDDDVVHESPSPTADAFAS